MRKQAKPRFEDSLSYELPTGEVVARFIYSKSHFSALHGRPKPGAFDPSPHDELSVAHSTGLQNGDVWNIAKLTLGSDRGRDKVHARTEIPVKELKHRQLRAIRDDHPFERHTSVKGWPIIADINEQKAQRKQICLELSQHPEVKLLVPPAPITRDV